MNLEKKLIEDKLVAELYKIRSEMDHDLKKAKQQLTNLAKNISNRIGKCFAMRKLEEIY